MIHVPCTQMVKTLLATLVITRLVFDPTPNEDLHHVYSPTNIEDIVSDAVTITNIGYVTIVFQTSEAGEFFVESTPQLFDQPFERVSPYFTCTSNFFVTFHLPTPHQQAFYRIAQR